MVRVCTRMTEEIYDIETFGSDEPDSYVDEADVEVGEQLLHVRDAESGDNLRSYALDELIWFER